MINQCLFVILKWLRGTFHHRLVTVRLMVRKRVPAHSCLFPGLCVFSHSHGNKEVFSCLGIHFAVNFFLERGHSDITVFVPSWRKEQPRPDVPITGTRIAIQHHLQYSTSFFNGCSGSFTTALSVCQKPGLVGLVSGLISYYTKYCNRGKRATCYHKFER